MISVACVYLMVVAAFYVMTYDVRADEGTVEPIAESYPDHAQRRMTISDGTAARPSAVIDPQGIVQLVWVDTYQDRSCIKWKKSADRMSTFTADLAITPSFYRIEDISIATSDELTALAFSAQLNETSDLSVYAMLSLDQGNTWTPTIAIGQGDAPSITVGNETAYLAFNADTTVGELLQVISLKMTSDEQINGTGLISLNVDAQDTSITCKDDAICVSFSYVGERNVLAYACIGTDGSLLQQPCAVSNVTNVPIIGLELLLTADGPRIVYGQSYQGISFISMAYAPDNLSNDWGSTRLLAIDGDLTDLDPIITPTGLAVAYSKCVENVQSVEAISIDLDGDRPFSFGSISTANLTADEPCLIVDSFGVLSCVFVESHLGGSELFMFQDMMFIQPDIDRLMVFVSSLDTVILINGSTTVGELIESLTTIKHYKQLLDEQNLTLSALILESKLDDLFRGPPLSNLDKIDKVKEKIHQNVQEMLPRSVDDAVYYDAYSPGSVQTLTYGPVWTFDVTDPVVTVVNRTSVWINWTTLLQESGENKTVYVTFYEQTQPDVVTTVNATKSGPNSATFSCLITDLAQDSAYYTTAHTVIESKSMDRTRTTGFTTPGNLTISNIEVRITQKGTSMTYGVEVSWYTNIPTNGTFLYGYGTTNQTNLNCSINTSPVFGNSRTHEHTVGFDYTVSLLEEDPPKFYWYKIMAYGAMDGVNLSTQTAVSRLHDNGPPSGSVYWEEPYPTYNITFTNRTSATIIWHTKQDHDGSYLMPSISYHAMGNSTVVSKQAIKSGSLWNQFSVHLTDLEEGTIFNFTISPSPSITDWYGPTISSGAFATWPGLKILTMSCSSSWVTATVYLTTTMAANVTVCWGTTTNYDHSLNVNNTATCYAIQLTGLQFDTQYYYKVRAFHNGNETLVNEKTGSFRTARVVISSITTSQLTPWSERITWNTNCDATGGVDFGYSYDQLTYHATANTGTSHSVDLIGLAPNTTYYFKIWSRHTTYTTAWGYSSILTFRTMPADDAYSGGDASPNLASAVLVETANYSASLTSGSDLSDCFKIRLNAGESACINVTFPSSTSFILKRYSQTNVLEQSVSSVSGKAGIILNATTTGYWKINITLVSGSGQIFYRMLWKLMPAMDVCSLDVGLANDTTFLDHLPGISLVANSGWQSPSNNMREGLANSCFLLNLYNNSYQTISSYQVSIRYTSTADVPLAMFNGASWVNLTTLPGKTASWSHVFVLDGSILTDSDLIAKGLNAKFRFGHQVVVDRIDLFTYGYRSGLFSTNELLLQPVRLETGWTVGNGVVNGTAGATMLLTLSRADINYIIELTGTGLWDGIELQQYTSAGYVSLGTIVRYSTSAVVLLNSSRYLDLSSIQPGKQVRIKVMSPLVNLTGVKILPGSYEVRVGTSGDSSLSSHAPGISIIDIGGEWSSSMTYDSRTVRKTNTGKNANFNINGAFSDRSYELTITYKTTSSSAVIKQFDGLVFRSLFALTGDNKWRTATIPVNTTYYKDITSGRPFNITFEITSSTSVYVNRTTCSFDTDGDNISDAREAARINVVYKLNPFSSDSDNDGLKDDREAVAGTCPIDADTDDGVLDVQERYSFSWSSDAIYQIPDNGQNTNYIDIAFNIPKLNGTIASVWVHVGIMHESQSQVKLEVKRGTATAVVLKANGVGTGANLFESYDLLKSGYVRSDFNAAVTWHVLIKDFGSGSVGSVQYVKVQVDGSTNPLAADSDSDGLSDGAERENGTSPLLADSDADGIIDRYEILGMGPSGKVTDPLSPDTDDDGAIDGQDVDPLGDVMIKVTFVWFMLKDKMVI